MDGLPPKPSFNAEFPSTSRARYPSEDRRLKYRSPTPNGITSSRRPVVATSMASEHYTPYSRRDDRDYRDRERPGTSERSAYGTPTRSPPPRSRQVVMADSYVAPTHDRIEEDRRVDTYIPRGREQWVRERDRNRSRSRTQRDFEWDRERERDLTDRDRWERDRNRYRGEERDVDNRRGWQREPDRARETGRSWEPSEQYERQTYERDRGPGREREDERPYAKEREPDRERRWERQSSTSPSRRPAPYDRRQFAHSPHRRQPSPTYSHRSYAHSQRTRSSSPRGSTHHGPRPHSPNFHGQVKLGDHSIVLSPHSSPSLSGKSREPDDSREYDRERNSEQRFTGRPRSSTRSRSRSRATSPSVLDRMEIALEARADDREPIAAADIIKKEEPMEHSIPAQPLKADPSEEIRKPNAHTPSPPSSPIKQEAQLGSSPAYEAIKPLDKGKAKEEPDRDGDIRMPDISPGPSPPKGPRASMFGSGSSRSSYRRSPPRAPRHGAFANPPTTPNLNIPSPAVSSPQISLPPASNLPPKPEWTNNIRRSTSSQPTSAQENVVRPKAPTQTTEPLKIDEYLLSPRAKKIEHLYTELTRVEAHRKNLKLEYMDISRAKRRALHELDIAAVDLKLAEERRKVADAQLAKARAGVLGINAEKET